MKTLLVWLLVGSTPLLIHAQPLSDILAEMYELENYQGAVELALSSDSLDLQSTYTVGLCFYALDDDFLALECFNTVLAEDPDHIAAQFFKSQSLQYIGNPEEALSLLLAIYRREPYNCDYVMGLGSAYYATQQPDSALYYFKKAGDLDGCMESLYLYQAEAYEILGHPDSSLQVYYDAVMALSTESAVMEESLYNVGVIEFLNGNLEMAEKAFRKLIEIRPRNMQYVSKLVQVYYANEEYERGDSLKQRIFGAYDRGELDQDILNEGFCFDQFAWRGKRVFAFETIAQDSPLYNKYVFYLADEKGIVLQQIQLEHRPDVVDKGYFYVIGHMDDTGHVDLWQYLFEADVAYTEVKKSILRILKKM